MSGADLLVCAPLRLEARALRAGFGPRVRRTGCGPRRSAEWATAHAADDFDALLIAGLAGGTARWVHPGDVVVADEIRGPRGTTTCSRAPALAEALRWSGLRVHLGPVRSAARLAVGARRTALAREGVLAADLESAWLAEAAGDRPVAAVRVVVDAVRRPLPSPGTPVRALRALSRLRELAPGLHAWRLQLNVQSNEEVS
ncbi:hypothetical protein [Saccharopolyspora sp. CA-218241]|uniref:hypothetical protein n=1 Tax=Saccharopolyspora sp. CA-218241 TaxID=3240027 RepID=UPI003D99552A